jgi:hypothetical protein
MSSRNLVRWSGLAAMVGAVLWPLWAGVEQSVGWGQPDSTAYERYELINRLLPFALLPVVVGFIGLHVAQRRSYGRLGMAGFTTVLVGFMLIIVGSVSEFWVFSDQPYDETGFGRGASWALFLLGHPLLAVGTVLFGIATARAKVLPRNVAMMFTVLGAFVVVPFTGTVFFAFPFVWLGYLLYSSKFERGQHPSRVS